MMRSVFEYFFTRVTGKGCREVCLVLSLCLLPGGVMGPHASQVSFAVASEPVHAVPGYGYYFPRDHGAHEAFLLEWWYFTGHLFTQSGRRFGYELTFFRRAMNDPRVEDHPSQWAIRHLYLGHFAVTDVEHHTFRFAEKLSRAGLGKAGAQTGQLNVWIDRWSVRPVDQTHGTLHLEATDREVGIDLLLTSSKTPTIHGENGVSRKGAGLGQASHYYSLTRLETKGTITIGGEPLVVTGLSWMDHEFGSGVLGKNQVGWDWFSLQLDGQLELMVYMLRRQDGTPDPASSGSLIFRDGTSRHLTLPEIVIHASSQWLSSKSGARYPSSWTLEVPSAELSLSIQPVQEDQELRTSKSPQVTYWEGAVDVHGTYQGSLLQGVGYVELTGYAAPLDMQGK